MGKIICFGDIHVHHTHKFSKIEQNGYSVRELEHLSCADTICKLIDKYQDCEKVVFLGDFFGPVGDNISCQSMNVVTEIVKKISNKCKEKGILFDILVGNHDVSGYMNNKYTHKLYPFTLCKNVRVFDSYQEDGNFVFVPYFNDDEYATNILNSIENKENKIVFSHMELKHIDLGMGIVTSKGVDPNILKQFKMTISGHYHNGVNYAKNIQVCGSTQRLSFKDKGISRNNIIIYDTETNSVKRESFECPDWFCFTDENLQDIFNLDSNNYVKVEVIFDKLITDKVIEKLKTFKGYTLSTKLNRLSTNMNIKENFSVEKEDDLSVLKKFIEKADVSGIDKENLLNEGIRLLNNNSSI